MANIFSARMIEQPSFIEPDFIVTMAQASGFLHAFYGDAPRVKLGTVDKEVYIQILDVRSQIAVNQASHNLLPMATLVASFMQTPTYLMMDRAEYNDVELAEAGEWNIALPMAQRLAMRQGHYQAMRVAALFGFNASNGEGLLNTPGATQVNLPPDPFGNTTLLEYDAGALTLFFLQQMNLLATGMWALGTPLKFTILGPQRVLGTMQFRNIIQLTTFQRQGAGTATTAQAITEVAGQFGHPVEWAFDDTLLGKGGSYGGASGSDVVVLICPEMIIPGMEGINTNEFGGVTPNMGANSLIYCDVPAPVEVTTPIPQGLDIVSSMRITPGWGLRSQALYILTMPYGS